jgi:hypothetical protein
MFWWSLGIVSVVFGGVEGHTDYEMSLVGDILMRFDILFQC